MKKLLPILFILLLSSCSFAPSNPGSNSDTDTGHQTDTTTDTDTHTDTDTGTDTTTDTEPYYPPEKTDDVGPILHAWDWSISRVNSELDAIEAAGYKAIQLSPLHPSKEESASKEWWNLYQPLKFSVATGSQNPLGNKQSLINLCNAAKQKGIRIIMDIVANHLAGGGDGFDSRVMESYIKDNDLMHHKGGISGDDYNNNRQQVVQGHIDLPDLKTEHTYVQNRVAEFLQEYISCGVGGFRFDAAKHIESPYDDSSYKSEFWNVVLNAAYQKAEQLNMEKPYVYGEILDNPGGGVGFNVYTSLMDVTDSRQADSLVSNVKNNNAGGAASDGYNVGKAEYAMLWAESHDTWAHPTDGNSTYNVSDDLINLAYCIQISRKDATALYFARPYYSGDPKNCPQVVNGVKSHYKSAATSAANKFHNDFVGASESLKNDGTVVMNIRKKQNNEGVLLANLNLNESSKTVNVSGLSNGTYVDIISNNNVTVTNGTANVNFNKGICVLEKNPNAGKGPRVSLTASKEFFADSTTISISTTDATSSSYKVDNGNATSFSGSTSFTLSNLSEGDHTITVTASNDNGTTNKSITVTKSSLANKKIVITGVPTNCSIVAWVYPSGGSGTWVDFEKSGTTYGMNPPSGNDKVIFVLFPNSTTNASNANWNNRQAQTDSGGFDIGTNQVIYRYSELGWINKN